MALRAHRGVRRAEDRRGDTERGRCGALGGGARGHPFDDLVAIARALPGYRGEESWENPANGLISNVYYWDSLEALQVLVRHPVHLQAKSQQARWLPGLLAGDLVSTAAITEPKRRALAAAGVDVVHDAFFDTVLTHVPADARVMNDARDTSSPRATIRALSGLSAEGLGDLLSRSLDIGDRTWRQRPRRQGRRRHYKIQVRHGHRAIGYFRRMTAI